MPLLQDRFGRSFEVGQIVVFPLKYREMVLAVIYKIKDGKVYAARQRNMKDLVCTKASFRRCGFFKLDRAVIVGPNVETSDEGSRLRWFYNLLVKEEIIL